MAEVVGRIVRAFRSLDYGQWNTGNHASSVRRQLDTPRLLLNMMHTDDGHLWLPPALEDFVTGVSGTGDIYLIRQTFTPTGYLIVQKGTTVSVYDLGSGSLPFTSADATTVLTDDEKIWLCVFGEQLYFGNSTQTLKVETGPTITDITDPSIPDGYHSIMYRNRRFVLERVFGTAGGSNQRIYYSDIGDAETFGADSFIDLASYYEGDSWENAIGSPVALEPFADALAVLTSQGVVRFTGTDPTTNFTLRPTMAAAGAWMRDSVANIAPGVLYFGGTPRAEWGFYLWQGNSAQLVSEQLNGYLRQWGEQTQTFSEDLSDATVWRDRYIATLDIGNIDPTIFVYDWRRQTWSTFNGWARPTVGLARKGTDFLCVAEADSTTVQYTSSPMFRANARTPGIVRVGYEDEEQPSGLVRFQEVRLTVQVLNAELEEGVTVSVVARLPGGQTVLPAAQTLTTSGQHTMRFPLKVRGSAIDLDISVAPTAGSQEAVIENLELVQSRKALKVPRIGGVIDTAPPTPVASGDATVWRRELTPIPTGPGTVEHTFGVPTGTVEGDLMFMFTNINAFGGFTSGGVISLPTGWTSLYYDNPGNARLMRVAYKVADATDEANAGGSDIYTLTATIPSPVSDSLDEVISHVVALNTTHRPYGYISGQVEGTQSVASLTEWEIVSGTIGDYALVLVFVDNNSTAGSRTGFIDAFTGDTTEVTTYQNPTNTVSEDAGIATFVGGDATWDANGGIGGTIGVWGGLLPMVVV